MNDTKDTTETSTTTAHDVLNALAQNMEPRNVTRAAVPQAPAVAPTVSMMQMSNPDGSTNVAALFTAMAKAQGEFGDIERRMTARIKSKREGGADYSYAYAPLDEVLHAVRPALSKNGIAVMQFPQTKHNAVTVRTLLAHESGQCIWNDLSVGCVSTDAKDIASAITYARRYALLSLLGVAPDTDDDGIRGRGESGHVQTRQEKRPPPDLRTADDVKDDPIKSLITSCRQVKQGDRIVYAIKSTTGECFTDDKTLYDVAHNAMRSETPVVLATERKQSGSGRVYASLVEIR